VSKLLAEDKKEESVRVIIGIFRVNFVFVTLICLSAIFLGRSILVFLSTPSYLLDKAYHFLISYLVSYPTESIVSVAVEFFKLMEDLKLLKASF
jgi:Na+-driven multidrug efflux pump